MSIVEVSESPFASMLGTNHIPSEDEISAIQKHLVTLVAATTTFDKGIGKLQKELKTLQEARDALCHAIELHKALISPLRRYPDILQEIFHHCLPTAHDATMNHGMHHFCSPTSAATGGISHSQHHHFGPLSSYATDAPVNSKFFHGRMASQENVLTNAREPQRKRVQRVFKSGYRGPEHALQVYPSSKQPFGRKKTPVSPSWMPSDHSRRAGGAWYFIDETNPSLLHSPHYF